MRKNFRPRRGVKLKPRQRISSSPLVAASVPHSWSIDTWPTSVWPCDKKKAFYLLRTHARELQAAGALARIGRARIILGGPYAKWLTQSVRRFADIPPLTPNVNREARRAEATTERVAP